MSKWILCDERLPKEGQMVLTTIRGHDVIIVQDEETFEEAIERVWNDVCYVSVGFIGSDGWYGADGYPQVVHPIAWMPLPKPYRAEQTEPSVSEIPTGSEPQTDDFFRDPTAEERKAVADYIDSISVPTGVNVFDLMDEPQNHSGEATEMVKDEPQTDGYISGEDFMKIFDEPQTETSTNLEKVQLKGQLKDEPQTTSTPYKVDTSSICKIEPQTDCLWK